MANRIGNRTTENPNEERNLQPQKSLVPDKHNTGKTTMSLLFKGL